MKIEIIEINNINSLRGYHRIDFTSSPFHHQSLFAITGPTGSGKTSILDAITLALYNRVPRLGTVYTKDVAQNGAILTRGEKEAYSKVTYSCKAGRFISEWRIATNRNGNLNAYEMSVRVEGDVEEYLTNKKSEVPQKNEELIGLNYDQFVKSVMLAQGDFAKFLSANKNDRSALLETIIGTEIYRKLGIKAYEKAKQAKTTLDDLKKIKQNIEEDLLSNEQEEQLKNEKHQLVENIHQVEKQQTQLKKQLEQKESLQVAKKQYNDIDHLLSKNKKEIEYFEQNDGLLLSQHDTVTPVAETIKEWQTAQEELNVLQQNRIKIEKEMNSQKQEKKTFQQTISRLLGKSIKEEDYIDELSKFEQRVRQLDIELKELLQNNNNTLKQANIYLEPIGIQLNNNNRKTVEEHLNQRKKQAELTINQTKDQWTASELANIEQTEQLLDEQLEKIQNARAKANEIAFAEKELQETKKRVHVIETNRADLPKQIKQTTAELKEKRRELDMLSLTVENQKLRASLEDHRKNLVDGEPCPLCGAIHHPFSIEEHSQNQSELEKRLLKHQNLVEELKNKLTKFQSSLEEKDSQINQLNKEIQTRLSEINHKKKQFASAFSFSLTTDWEKAIAKIKNKTDDLKAIASSTRLLKAAEKVNPLLTDLDKIKEKGSQKRKEKNNLYNQETPVHTRVNQLQKQWSTIDKNEDILQERATSIEHQIKKESEKFKRANHLLLEFISQNQIESVEWVIQSLLPLEKVKTYRQKRETLLGNQKQLLGQLKVMSEQVKQLSANSVEQTKEQLEKQLKNQHKNREAKLTQLDQLKHKLISNEERKTKIVDYENQLKKVKETNKYWFMLQELIGDATGKKFNNFAQELTLKQLLYLANKRLQSLNKRYILDRPNSEEDDSLTIIDAEMGGVRRSAATLSGGESFVISLALALGLSDLASKNIEINSLFIDEGFGTLDGETLDQTLDTLERLQQEGSKIIGIISHVPSLKERIVTQIQVSQNGRGYSKLKIVG